MSLRHRLVVVLVVLVAVGLSGFAVVSYQLYSRSQFQLIDDQLQAASPLLVRYLDVKTPSFAAPGQPGEGGPGGGGGNQNGDPDNLPPGSFVQLRDASGRVVKGSAQQVGCYASSSRCPEPALPAVLKAGANPQGRLFTTGAIGGSGTFRVLIKPLATGSGLGQGAAPPTAGDTIVTAVSLTNVTRSLHRLIVLDLAVGLGVLVVLSGAGLVVVRRGLRPLERMASTATAIAGGDLSRRVAPADDRTEVGQLGRAFNVMMANIQGAFSARDRTERRLRQFLADASHELRTPLTSIRGYAELYRMGAAGTEAEREIVMARIEEHAKDMGSLIEELLLLTRLDETRPPERLPVELGALVAEAANAVAIAAPDRMINVKATREVVVVGDRAHLRQAATNLLTNAVRHTPPGSPIDVSVLEEGGVAVVAVRDRGPGLSAEALTSAFERFWRADPSRSGKGSGLGLAIVAGVAAEHFGQATAANREGGGAEFTLRLPVPVPTTT
jgi:two-component system OmpR family sensor kinase